MNNTTDSKIEVSARAALVWIVLEIGMTCATTPAMAQTYDPNYPVCIEKYSIGGGYIDCSFTSMPQCKATASGRGGQCFDNPYFAPRGRAAQRR
jgi:hypothetical protein